MEAVNSGNVGTQGGAPRGVWRCLPRRADRDGPFLAAGHALTPESRLPARSGPGKRRILCFANCLSYALEAMPEGIWGGTTEDERRAARGSSCGPRGRRDLAGRTAGCPGCGQGVPGDVLVDRARRGCLSAYDELTDRHGPPTYRVALRLLDNRHDAADLTREALVAARQNLATFRGDSSFAAWLLQILVRCPLSRTSPIRDTGLFSQPGSAVPGGAPPAREADAVAAVVAALTPAQRVVIVLHDFEGMSDDQVALITSTTVPAVRRHLLQARRTVARAIRERTPHETVSSAGESPASASPQRRVG